MIKLKQVIDMETYHPYPSIPDSVECYDQRTMSRVRRSVLYVLDVLHETKDVAIPFEHPEVERWKGYAPFLCQFGYVLDEVFLKRLTIKPPNFEFFEERITWHLDCATYGEYTLGTPPWWGVTEVHVADQAALLRSNYDHYSKYFEGVSLITPPYWML